MDFSQYQPPGVYVGEDSAPAVPTVGVPATVVCLIGRSRGYQTYTETVTLPATNATGVALTQGGIFQPGNPAAVAAPVVTVVGGATLTLTTDYTLTYDATSGLTTVTPQSASAFSKQVQVTYNFADSGYYGVKEFTEYSSVEQIYGPAWVTSTPAAGATQVATPLAMAAKVAFENGAARIKCVALDATGGAALQQQFQNAYAKIYTDYEVSIVIPVLDGTDTTYNTSAATANLVTDVATHCAQASADGLSRVSIVGTPINADSGDGQGAAKALAAAAKSARVMVAYPNALYAYNGSLNQTTQVSGAYLAAAYAGRFAAIKQNKALTRESVRSFSGLPPTVQTAMTKANKNAMSQSGVAVTEISRQGVLVVRHGVASDMTSVLTREMSITRAKDAVVGLVQQAIENAGLIGTPIDEDTPFRVKSVVVGALDLSQRSGLAVAYSEPQVRQQALPSGDPSVIDVKFSYRPAVPLNYVTVTFSLDLSTGDTTNVVDTSASA